MTPAVTFGCIWVLIALSAFLSMFRYPLRYLLKCARGEKVVLLPEFRQKQRS